MNQIELILDNTQIWYSITNAIQRVLNNIKHLEVINLKCFCFEKDLRFLKIENKNEITFINSNKIFIIYLNFLGHL